MNRDIEMGVVMGQPVVAPVMTSAQMLCVGAANRAR